MKVCWRTFLRRKLEKITELHKKTQINPKKVLTLCRKRCILFRHSTRGHHKPVREMKKVLIGRKKCLTGWHVYGILIELPLRNQRKTQDELKRVWKNFLTKQNACVKLIKLLLQNSDDIKREVLIRNEKKFLTSLEVWCIIKKLTQMSKKHCTL